MQVASKRQIDQPAVVPKPRTTDVAARPPIRRRRVAAAAAAGALVLAGIGAGTAALVTMSGDVEALRQQVAVLSSDVAEARTEALLRSGEVRFQNEHTAQVPVTGTGSGGASERSDGPR